MEVRDDEESGPFEEQHLIRVNDVRKRLEVALQLLHIGDELVDYAGPRLVEGVIFWTSTNTRESSLKE